MLNFDQDRFLKTETGAVKTNAEIQSVLDRELDSVDNIYFIGSGGVGILFDSTVEFARSRSAFPFHRVIAAEFMLQPNKTFSNKSLVVIPSLSGTTKETLELVKYCEEHDVRTLALVGSPDTPLQKEATYAIYNDVLDDTSSENYYLQGLMIVLYVMLKKGEIDQAQYDSYISDFEKLPEALLAAKKQAEPIGEAFANEHKETPYHIITGAGDSFAEAYYYGMCILEEMQWIKTRPVQAADFFHGTLELIEKGVSVIIMKGEDKSRSLSDRVERFVPKFTDQVTVIDTKAYDLPGISENTREIISSVVLATVLERFSAHLEVVRDHPLTFRRYYKKMEY
ncbi:SIS domain-containing protein [Lacticaseibacillus suilingensis]|uniref:Fructosamine deglycase n=1 Tax=Lacticaseibacillus suilingensis TaxID=2799577 RepID=A0ABW4BGR8_9LACO|nr:MULTISPECIES: SIS domain-containing protein [Lacticaseibacillus]